MIVEYDKSYQKPAYVDGNWKDYTQDVSSVWVRGVMKSCQTYMVLVGIASS